MNLRRSVSYIAVMMLMVIGLTACAKKAPPPAPAPPPPPAAAPAPPPPPPPPPPTPPPPPPPAPRPLTEEEVFSRKTVDQLNGEMPLADVHFDYDKSNVRDEDRGILQTNADYLKKWTTLRVTVEGHADQRGTSEYNLALGDRRANAVKEYLTGLGIAADRLTVVSKGKEQLLCQETTDDCYARNRRGHFVITAK